MKTYTKGNVIIEDIEIGDIHYEYGLGTGIKVEVITEPVFDEDKGGWRWKSKHLATGKEINYFVNPKYSSYGPNLYDYEAYRGIKLK